MANDHKFGQDDPLEHSGTHGSGGDFIQESTMIPESGLILPEEHAHHDDGPQIVGADHHGKANSGDQHDHGDAIGESVSSVPSELPTADKSKMAGAKKNLPMVIFGVIAAGLIGVVGVKTLGSSDQPQAVAQPAPVATVVAAKPATVVTVAPVVVQKTPEPVPAPAPAPVEVVAPIVVAMPASTPASSLPSASSAPAAGVQITQTVQTQTGAATPAVAVAVPVPVVVAASGADDMYSTKGMNIPPVKPVIQVIPAVPVVAVIPVTPSPVTTVTKVTTVAPVVAAAGTPAAVVAVAPGTPAAPVVCEPAHKSAVKATGKKISQTGSGVHRKVKGKKAAATPLPSTDGYKLHMGANGLAWVTLPSGETQIVSKGNRIEGLGVITEIDLRAHLVRVGRVILR